MTMKYVVVQRSKQNRNGQKKLLIVTNIYKSYKARNFSGRLV